MIPGRDTQQKNNENKQSLTPKDKGNNNSNKASLTPKENTDARRI